MATWVVILSVVIATAAHVGQVTGNSELYGEIPTGNYSAVSNEIAGYPGLSHLFVMAQEFVNVVFPSFSELEDLITKILESNDFLGYIFENWQQLLSLEAGFVACLVFGFLFFIFVPLVGSIMCCCRCCCDNCGGKLQQSKKRSKSRWRQCLCVSMFVLTTFMAVPTVLVFLTNEWITDVVETSPNKINGILEDTSVYLKLVPRQLTYMTDQYATVDGNIRPLVSDFGVSIGEPLKVRIEDEAEEALEDVADTIVFVDNVTNAVNDVSTSVSTLKTGTASLQTSLDSVATILGGITCANADTVCLGIRVGASGNLQLGFNPNDFDPLIASLADVNSSINGYDLTGLQSEVNAEIDNIPQKVRNETASSSSDALEQLDDTNQTVSDLESQLPTEGFTNIDGQIESVRTLVSENFETYNTYFDKYRYIAGIVLGSILAIVVFCYYLGMFLGICGYQHKTPATERGAASNCGGIMLMVGVGFSFIFSWLLMFLVIVTFTIGGHLERYGCQAVEPPDYVATRLLENISNLNLANELALPEGVKWTFKDILSACEENQGVYQAFNLQYVFNVTEEIANVTSAVNDINSTVSSAISDIDFSSIRIYPDSDKQQVLDLKNSGIDSIDYASYKTKLGRGITSTDLTQYAEGLRQGADNFDPLNSAAATIVRAQADEIIRIQNTMVEPLQDDYDTLSSSIDTLSTQSTEFNGSIDTLDNSLTALNQLVTVNGEDLASDVVSVVTDIIVGNVTSYTSWMEQELTQNLGACRPIYDTYIGVIGLFCDYLIDTINGLWFSLGWCVFFLIPSAIVAMKLMKFFRRMNLDEQFEDDWDNIEMRDTVGTKPNENIYVPVLPNY